MSIFGGVRVTGFISPSTSGDTYAVIDPIYGIDGLRSVANSVERNAVTTLRRRAGMIVYQQDNDNYYKLLPSPWTNTDSDWVVLGFSGATAEETVVYFSASTVGQTYFNSVLPTTPTDITETKLFINGVKYRYGINYDYIITGGTSVVWYSSFEIDPVDEICVTYF